MPWSQFTKGASPGSYRTVFVLFFAVLHGTRWAPDRVPSFFFISAAEGLEPVPTGSESTTLPMSYPTLDGTPERPCRNLADALAVPARDTLPFTAPGRVPLGIPTGTGRAPVTFSEKEDKSPLIASRAPAGSRQDSGRVSVKHYLIMTTVPRARQGLIRSRSCSQPGRGPG